jgi:flavodoxin
MKPEKEKLSGKESTRILVVYYTFSRTTEKLAEEIAKQTGGDLRSLVPEKPYAFDNNTAAKQARMEIERGYCPKLLTGLEPIDGHSRVFIGSPNWFKTFAPPVLSFLRNVDLVGKTVIPFCTHGGGWFGNMEADIAKECPRSKMLTGFTSMSSFEPAQVRDWLLRIGLLKQ